MKNTMLSTLAAILLGIQATPSTAAATYKATLLDPPGYVGSSALRASGGSQVGNGDLPGFITHALLWHGTAASFVDLHPAGYTSSFAQDVWENTQVGVGITAGGDHALLWNGTAASAVDLHPMGFSASTALDVFGNTQVGAGNGPTTGIYEHALLWHGTAESVVDLNPIGFQESRAQGTGDNAQVGWGIDSSGRSRALLWHGTAQSVVNLQPAGFFGSQATDVAGNTQVGLGQVNSSISSPTHALVWRGTADSVVDLHAVLASLGPAFVTSVASGIDANGDIVGQARDANQVLHAVKWTLVPEPATSLLALAASISLALVGRRRRLVAKP